MQLSEENLAEKLTKAINTAYDNRVAIQTKQRAQKSLYGTDKTVEEIVKYK